jgi:tRNA-modifying protein YgfZ
MSEWFRLSHLAAVIIGGPDAHEFAQAQFTQDLANSDPPCWRPGAWCEPRGRVLATMLACRREEDIVLVVPEAQVDLLLGRLPMFAIGRRVEISAAGTPCARFGADGDAAGLSHDPDRLIALEHEPCPRDEHQLRRWQQADLALRFPWLGPGSSGQHLPQSLGLEALDALSYTKGCFPGQEVIARVHYLGQVRYRTALVGLETSQPPPPGTVLRLDDGKRAGELLWGLGEADSSQALAVVSIDIGDQVEIHAEAGNTGISGRVSL